MMRIRTNSAYDLMNSMLNELERSVSSTQADTDVLETNDAVIVKVNLPGVSPENVELNLERNLLTLTAQFEDILPEGAKYLHRERVVGEQKRVVQIPVRIAADQVQANLENGVLTVKIAKATESQAKRITINATSNAGAIQS
ncbi:MAG: Hsp20/alpha crystallin family protein [Deinococcales bacterium]